MKSLLKFGKIVAVLLVVFFAANQNSYATHAMGADITYRCIGNNKYIVTYEFYYDCAGTYVMQNPYLFNLHSTSCGFDTTFAMTRVDSLSDIEVTPICPNITSRCTNPNSTYPGVKIYIYRDTLDLNIHHCDDFIMSYSMGARNNAINTLSANYNLTVFAMLNDSIGLNNNSPTFSNLPVPYICEGQLYCYNNGASDVDGDSIVYALMTPLAGATYPFTPVTYNATFDSAQPVTTSIPPTFQTENGTFCLDASAYDVGVIAILVSDYRNGVLIGQVERDIQINVIQCLNNIPTVSGINGDSTLFTDTICSQVPYTFQVFSNDADPQDTVTMWWNGNIPGATFVVTGTPHPTGTFTWTPPASAANTISYCFAVNVKDNACPYEGVSVHAYCLRVVGANIGFLHGNVCTHDVSFTDTSTIPAGTITGWNWNFGDSLSGANDTSSTQNPHHVYTDTGIYTVQLVLTSSWGCNDTAYETIHVQIGQTTSYTSTDATCSNSNDGTGSVIITSGGIPPFTFHWSNGATTATVGGLAPGTYNVSVTDSVGCLVIDNVVIHAPPPLVADSVHHNIYCHDANNAGLASVNPTGGTGPYLFHWSGSPSTTGTASTLIAGNYGVTVTDAHGCSITHMFHISAQATLGSDSAQINVSCFGGNNGIAMVHVFSEPGPFTYHWSPSTAGTTATVSNLPTGNYTVIIDDGLNCYDTIDFTILSHPQMMIILDSAAPIPCNGNLSLAVVVDTGGTGGTYNYTWSTSPIQHTATATGLQAGTYFVTVTDSLGCLADTSITITQPSALASTHSHTDVICFGGNTGTATSVPTGGTTIYNYSWSPSGGNASLATGLIAGNYTVVITDANGCTLTDFVTIGEPTDLIVTAIPVSQTICADTTINIGATGSNGSPGYTFSWSNGPNSQTQSVHPTSTTVYTVTVTDTHGCTKTKDVTVNVNALPNPHDSATSVCWGDSSRIWVYDGQPGWTYNWLSRTGTNSYLSFLSGTTEIDSVQVTDANGCKSKWIVDSGFIKGPHVIANFIPDSLEGFQPLDDIFRSTSSNAEIFSWYFNDTYHHNHPDSLIGLYDSIAFHLFDSAGVYHIMLVAENLYGCRDTIIKDITVKKTSHLVVWNTISPNHDGKNDEWLPDFHNMAIVKATIYNRWGLKVKEWTTPTGWDGTDNGGRIVPDGTYYYVLYCQGVDGINYSDHGFITVIK